MNRFLYILVIVILSCCADLQAIGSDTTKQVSQYVMQTYDVESGLPSITLADIIQTKDKYLWIGTYSGLVKFDGTKFEIFNTENVPELGSNSIITICEQKEALWVGTPIGITKLSNHKFLRNHELSKLNRFNISLIKTDSKNNLWIFTVANGVWKLDSDSKSLKQFESTKSFRSPVKSFAEDKYGRICVGTETGELYVFQEDNFVKQLSENNTGGIFDLIRLKNSTVLVSTSIGVFNVFAKGGIKRDTLFSRYNKITHLIEDKHDNLWFGNRGGLYRYRKVTQEIDGFTNEQGFPKGDIKKLLIDHEENLWVLTYRSGLLKFSSGFFVTYGKNEGLEDNLATTALQVKEDEYWIGIESGKIQKIKNGRVLPNWKTKTKLPNQRLKYLMQDSRGNIWASTYGGLLKLDEDGKRIKTKNQGLLNGKMRYTIEDSKGNIWVATAREGVLKINLNEEVQTFDSRNGLVSNFILSIDEAKNGDIWVGTNNGISIIRNDVVVKSIQMQDDIPTNMTFDLYLDGEVVWIASEKGLYRMEGKQSYLYEFEGNKGDNAVFDIMEDEESNLWFTSTRGVFMVSKKELNLKASNPQHNIKSRLLAKADGMKNQQSVGATKLMMDSQGAIWIPTIAGMAVVNPKNITFKKKLSPPIISKIVSSDSIFYADETSTIPAGGGKRLEIHFSSFDFTAPEKNIFKYRLVPFEYEWRTAEKGNVVRYTNLAGNGYSFQIQKGDNSGNWSEIESFPFVIESKFTETSWFYALLILVSLAIIWLLYKSRLQVIKANEEYLQERVELRTAEVMVQKEKIQAQNKELESTLNDLKETQIQLIHSEKMASLGQLTAGIAHEINNPINFISGGVEALAMILDDLFKVTKAYARFDDADETQFEEIKENVRNIKTEVEYDDLINDIGQMLKDIKYGTHRTAEIVLGLRNFSRSDETKKMPANLHECIEITLTILRNQYKDRIEVIRDFDGELPIINCKIGQINQVFMNIIANSVQAISGKGTIKISTKSLDNDKVEIIISDSGKGMSEEVRSKIFDPFFTTKGVGKGTGLGLSISHGIIKDHEGEVSVDQRAWQTNYFQNCIAYQ